MMQRGIETQDMDVRWVSSLSWYFLNLFGLNGLFRLILGSDNGMSSIEKSGFLTPLSIKIFLAADSAQDMSGAPPFVGMPGAQAGPQDYVKLFAAEKDNLEFAEGQYSWVGDSVERRVLEQWGKLPTSVKSKST